MLGRVAARRDGQPVAVPAGKTSELLVRLALDAGVLVRSERLIEDLWASAAVTTRRNTLQSKIARLRRALGDPAVIISADGGYKLAVDPSDVDAFVVLGHLTEALRLLETGDDRGASDLCASALKLYGGDVFPGAGEGDWVSPHRARLEEARIKLTETEYAARLRLGDAGDAVGELEAAVVTYPFQEGLWELLITALYRAGRQADALAAYQRVRNQLADELGLDPGPRLQQLERQILVHDATLGGQPRRPSLDPSAGNLPSIFAELVGRKAEVAALVGLLGAERLVEIVGAGGIGKTAVAIATGRDLTASNLAGRAGVWLARLEMASTPSEVVDTLVAALDVVGEAALFERLRESTAVVILDNCEHVIDATADLAVRLLDAAPGLRILCTSQVPLDVDGEAVFELAPLALDDAVELFTRRANTQRLHRESNDAGGAVEDLCRSLDGLPLAIELAAARTRTLSIADITRRLDDRFNVLSDPSSRKPERRRALRATIRWSYDLLFPDDQRGLWALATFSGGAPLGAVESVLEALDVPAAAAIDVVGRLASRSLVIVDDDGVSTPVRYRLLDSIRAFAVEAMTGAGFAERAYAAHAAWFAAAAASSTQRVRSSRQAEQLSFVRSERANIDAALTWSARHDPLLALSIVNGFGWAWVVLGDSRGAQRILAALDAVGDAAAVPDRASAMLLAGWIEASTGHLEPARDHIAAAAELADAVGDVDLQARCSYYLAYVVSHHGEFRHAMELTDRSRALYDELDRPWDQAANALFAARAAISAGDRKRGVEARDHVERWLRTVDDPGYTFAAMRCWASLPASSTGSTMPSSTSVAPRRCRVVSGSCRPRHTRSPVSVGRCARPVTTTPVLRPWSSQSTRPKQPATFAWRLSPASTSAASCVRSDSNHERGRRSKRRPPGIAGRAAVNRPRSANAFWPRWTPRTEPAAPATVSSRSSTMPNKTKTPPLKSSPSTHWPASPLKRAAWPRHGAFLKRRISAWRSRRTSSPTATGPTPKRSDTTFDREAHADVGRGVR